MKTQNIKPSMRIRFWILLTLPALASVGWIIARSPDNEVGGQTLSVVPLSSRVSPSSPRAPALGTLFEMHQRIEESPAWAVGYGKEFWRRSAISDRPKLTSGNGPAHIPSSIDLGQVIERVSHVLGTNSANPLPHLSAGTYAATWDGQGFRFSPSRPEADAMNPTARPVPARAISNQPEPDTEARFRTLSLSRQYQVLYRAGQLEWSVLGKTAQALLDSDSGLVEHCQAT